MPLIDWILDGRTLTGKRGPRLVPLGLHPKLKEKLAGTLAEAWPTLDIIRGIALTDGSLTRLRALDSSLPGHGGITEKLHRWISDQPLSDFLASTINIALMADNYEDGSHQPIASWPGWEDAGAKANELIDGFDQLPEMYIVTVPAPQGMEKFLEATGGQVRLSTAARIALATDKFSEDHPVTTGDERRDRNIWGKTLLGGLLGTGGSNYDWEGAYLQILKQGYVGRFIETATEHELVGDFKALWGVQLALGLGREPINLRTRCLRDYAAGSLSQAGRLD